MYRGPQSQRMSAQFAQITQYHGEGVLWRRWLSTTSGTGGGSTSAWLAGGGYTRTSAEQWITAVWSAAPLGQIQVQGGQMVAGDAKVSTTLPLGVQDELVRGGITYRVDSVPAPAHFNDKLWYQAVVCRADATG